ncbi:MAG: SCPU domain-containing protein [Deltaproteobacteria bacterium]|nr:SCPU domain-containing protein [Deltaproteobacteria bacterium]TLN03224.1 MAG: spore coat protein U domain-containing protein [bacterium]
MKCINRSLPVFLLLLSSVTAQAFHCSVTTTPVSFGSYDVFSPAPIDTIGTIFVSCNNPEKKAMPVIISINRGSSGSFNPRQMRLASGSDRMNYYLFLDPSRTTIWGDGSGGTSTVIRTIEKTSPLNLPVYGRIPARQNLKAGTYSDQLVVTVNW